MLQCEERGMTFKEVIAAVEAYIEEQHTYFVLETLETLRKNGRLTGLKAIAATVLNIKPVMGLLRRERFVSWVRRAGLKKHLRIGGLCVRQI